MHRCLRDAFIASESVFHSVNDFLHVLSRGKRVWGTSRIFWIILSVSQGMLNRIPSEFWISFFPCPHLRVSRTPWVFEITRIILSHQYALTWNETTCFCFRRWWSGRRVLLSSFRHLRLLTWEKKRMAVGKVAARKCGVVHDVKKMQQIVPPITCEIAFC